MRKSKVRNSLKILEQVAELESKLLSPDSQPLFCTNPCSKMAASLESIKVRSQRDTLKRGTENSYVVIDLMTLVPSRRVNFRWCINEWGNGMAERYPY